MGPFDREPKLRMRVNAREMMRVQGVYMYIINQTGNVGAMLGFFPLVVVMYEDANDEEPIEGFLRVDRWIYPLARSFSPIYIWGADKLIMPEPFSSLTEPTYIVLRLPLAMSKFQKDTLWNLLDVSAHVRGKFSDSTVEEILAKDKLFRLTEITPHERSLLDHAEEGVSPPGTKNLSSLKKPSMKHKLAALEKSEGRMSIVVTGPINQTNKVLEHKFKESSQRAFDPLVDCKPPSGTRRNEQFPLLPTNELMHQSDLPGNQPHLMDLPPIRGNLMRLYILGPRDLQHIRVSTVLEWIPLTELMLKAVQEVFRQQIRLRREKEELGFPPTFEGRTKRLIGGWGGADALNLFGVSKVNQPIADGPYMNLSQIDPSHKLMYQQALRVQNLEAASTLFDHTLDSCRLELLAYEPSLMNDAKHSSSWLGPLVPRPVVVRYRKSPQIFVHLNTLSATIKNDMVYESKTNYLERVHEDCEHHYPKLRPRNPQLDPQYPYPREPSPYLLS